MMIERPLKRIDHTYKENPEDRLLMYQIDYAQWKLI